MQVLDALREDHYVDEQGQLHHVEDMMGRGSDIDNVVTIREVGGDRYTRLIDICRLYDRLKGLCFNFQPHRFHPTTEICADCLKMKG
jgi:hypothetical protein